MKGKIVALLMLIAVVFFLACSHRNKPTTTSIAKTKRTNTPDSAIFKQLAKIKAFKRADSLYDADVYDSAICNYQRVFASPMLPPDPKYKQELYNKIGFTYIVLADYKKASMFLNKAMEFHHHTDSSLIDANTFSHLGTLKYYNQKPDTALFYYHTAYRIYTKHLGEREMIFVRLNTLLGNVYRWLKADYYNAEKYYYKALQIYENQRFDKRHRDYFNIVYSLASNNRLKRDYSKSLTYGLQAYQIANSEGTQVIYREISCALVANTYLVLRDYKRAKQFYDEALKLNGISKNTNGNRTLYLNNLAIVSNKLKNYNEAISYSKEALKLIANRTADFFEMSKSNALMGLAYLGLHQWDNARYHLNQNVNLMLKHLGIKHPSTAEAFALMAYYYTTVQNIDSALYYYQCAVISGSKDFTSHDVRYNPNYTQCLLNNNLIHYLSFKASVLNLKYKSHPDSSLLKISLQCYELLDSLVLFSRKSMDTETSKLYFTISSNELYEDAIECSYQLYQLHKEEKYIKEAFHFFERNKYLLLLEKLKTAEAINKAGIPDSLAEAEEKLSTELKVAQDKLTSAQGKDNKNKTSATIQTLNSQIFVLTRRLEELHSIFEKRFPSYFNIRYQDAVVQTDSLQQFLRTKNSNIAQYFWGKKSVYMIFATGNNMKFVKINNDEKLKDCLDKTIASTHEINFSSRDKYREYYQNSLKLYNLLLKPVLPQKEATQQSNLIIIPDGALSKLSFDALVTSLPQSNKFSYKNLDYFLYHYNTSYAYSLSILLSNRQTNRVASKFLGFGYAEKKAANKEMVGTVDEMNEVSRHFRSKVFLGADASEHNFKQQIDKYDIVHLALHGSADEENENGSKLVFRKDNDKVDDGMLYANEIYNLNLKAKLVVLSACETGIGKNYQGEGVFSISRAFSYAGCPSIVISLWNVNDQSTAKLMSKFYKHLVKGEEIGSSLHKAKLDFLQSSDEISYQPVFWASFVAFGDMSPIRTSNNFRFICSFLLSFILGSLGLYWLVMRKNKK